MQKQSSAPWEKREERKAGEGDFSLDEVMGDVAFRAKAELVADAPLTSLCQFSLTITHAEKGWARESRDDI